MGGHMFFLRKTFSILDVLIQSQSSRLQFYLDFIKYIMVHIVKDVGNRDISRFCLALGREELSVCVCKQIHVEKQ